jgi:hypothetical protein
MKRLFMAFAACICVALGAQAAETFNLPNGDIVEGTLVHESNFGVTVGPDDPDFSDEATFLIQTVGSHVAFLESVVSLTDVSFDLFFGDTLIGSGASENDVIFFSTNALDLDSDSFVRVVFGDSVTPSEGVFRVVFIPEPATWLMMIVGFAVVGLQLRRRERQAVDFA